jgi:hypothetical protein
LARGVWNVISQLDTSAMVREFRATAKGHGWPEVIDNYAGDATQFDLGRDATLNQLEGGLNGTAGRFEWIYAGRQCNSPTFVHGGVINGLVTKL